MTAHKGEPVYAMDFSPDGRTAASSGGDLKIRVWDTLTCALLLVLSGHTHFVKSIKYSLDGTRIVSASDDKTIKIWDAVSGALVCILPTDRVSCVVFTPDGRQIVSNSTNQRSIKIWDVQVGTCLATLTEHQSGVTFIAMSPDGLWMVSSSKDRPVYLWSLYAPYDH